MPQSVKEKWVFKNFKKIPKTMGNNDITTIDPILKCRGLLSEQGRQPAPQSFFEWRAYLHLRLQIVLNTDFFDQLHLGFQPIDVLFFVFQNMLEQLSGNVVVDAFTIRNRISQ